MKITLPLLCTLLLSACAGNYTFNSNLNGEAIDEYFKASDVSVFNEGEQPRTPYELKGMVEGETCQISLNDAPASIVEARTIARRAAADKGANGMIVKKCMLFEERTESCYSRAFCVAQAISLNTTEQ
ncbi:Rcs stress response system protein RcsF [Shewanella waksmanii]|uniref:Rcs stress response system protein RcsF n=1 Tax=Shewanella waksmanii TaxID=213783 RepID=UPI00048CD6CE|nr:Rcs stress response system protein RcsF [Shewanella waksmanii]